MSKVALIQILARHGRVSWQIRGSCGEDRIPYCRRSLVLGQKAAERELVLADPTEPFGDGDDRGRAIIVLETEHGPGPHPEPARILLGQVVQVFRGSQFALLPCSIFIGHFTYGAKRRSIPIQSNADRSAALGAKRFTASLLQRTRTALAVIGRRVRTQACVLIATPVWVRLTAPLNVA